MAAAKALEEDFPDFQKLVVADLNLYDQVDSFSLVNVLLETETELEREMRKYIPLASEKIFDASDSPFLLWRKWVNYVEKTIQESGASV